MLRAGVADGAERRVCALVRLGELVRVQAHVELRDVEPEQLDAPPQIGEVPVGDARPAVGTQARVHQLEVGQQAAASSYAGSPLASSRFSRRLPAKLSLRR